MEAPGQSQTGNSDTWLYVTLDSPALSYAPYESIYDISCKAADGQITVGGDDYIWAHFQGLTVRRKSRNGFNLTGAAGLTSELIYWASGGPAQNIGSMLGSPSGNSSCLAFAQLLKACWQVHGVQSTVVEVDPDPNLPISYQGFMVKEWSWDPNGPTTDLEIHVDITDDPTGIAAQNQPTGPASSFKMFRNHYVVRFAGSIFDPSYGVGPLTEEEHEDAAIDALVTTPPFCNLNTSAKELRYTDTGL